MLLLIRFLFFIMRYFQTKKNVLKTGSELPFYPFLTPLGKGEIIEEKHIFFLRETLLIIELIVFVHLRH